MPNLKTMALPEAAVILRLPYREAYDALLRGKLDGRRAGGRWYVTLASVRRLAVREQKGGPDRRPAA